MATKFCKRCGVDTERRINGKCKICTAANDALYIANNRTRLSAPRHCPKCRCDTERTRSGGCKPCQKDRRAREKAVLQAPQFCLKCNTITERHIGNGKCKPCQVVRDAKYYSNNRGKIQTRMADYRKNNSEKLSAQKAEYYIGNKEIILAWRKANPDKTAISGRARRARKLSAGGTHTAEDICAIMSYQQDKCACCAASIENGHHVDHIEPLSKGGSNDRSNLQLLCKPCNGKKYAKHPIAFMWAAFPEMLKSWAAALLRRREVIGF